jgi:hypothetical protein
MNGRTSSYVVRSVVTRLERQLRVTWSSIVAASGKVETEGVVGGWRELCSLHKAGSSLQVMA